MNKQYMEEVQKWKKADLMSIDNITISFYDSLIESDNISSAQRAEARKGDKWVSRTVMWHMTGP